MKALQLHLDKNKKIQRMAVAELQATLENRELELVQMRVKLVAAAAGMQQQEAEHAQASSKQLEQSDMLNQQIEEAQKDAAEKEQILEGVDEELDQMTDRCKQTNGRLGWWMMFVGALTLITRRRTTRNWLKSASELIAEREKLKEKGVELEDSLQDMQTQ